MDKEVRKAIYDVFYKDTGRKIEEISDEEMEAAYDTVVGAYVNLNMAIKKLLDSVSEAVQPILDIVEKSGKYKLKGGDDE